MTVADIACDHLKPKTKAAVNALLRHKDYAGWMVDLPVSDTDRARREFERAATWPDDVRRMATVGGRPRMTSDGDRDGVTLPPGYPGAAHRVADRQVALAGLRPAGLLNATKFSLVSTAPIAILPKTPAARLSAQEPIIGNQRSPVCHLPGESSTLPAEANRVYFQTESEAQKAGYHALAGAGK